MQMEHGMIFSFISIFFFEALMMRLLITPIKHMHDCLDLASIAFVLLVELF